MIEWESGIGVSGRVVDNELIESIAKGSRLDLKRVVSRDTGKCECVCGRCNGEAMRDATVLLSTIISMIVSIPG